ncbi:chemotaxis protein CheW [Paraburkholderia sp. GAS32]|uniref:chemotaxis protein CheW n=1 Tax=Paraburkholderia sp. GAS32 TaxID=3035129 RepID=UPI003D1C9E0A
MNAPEPDTVQETHEYLAFALGNEQYAVDILQVQEIRSYNTVTRIASAPEHIKGGINMRGQIVPIIDLRIRFGLDNASFNEQTVVIILNLPGTVIGAVVDSVLDVIEVTAGDMKEIPNLPSNPNTDHMSGIAAMDERMLIILDMAGFLIGEALVTSESTTSVQAGPAGSVAPCVIGSANARAEAVAAFHREGSGRWPT